jgi:hypothetical protein
MEITGTSNKTLAKHLIVDPSMISQLRTGARNVTKKNNHVKNMAFYFAGKCQTDSRLMALYELTQDMELKEECSITKLSDIIYEFLINDNPENRLPIPPSRPKEEIFKSNPRLRKAQLTPYEPSDKDFLVCRSLKEKKENMKKLFEYFLTLKSPDVIYFSSEEVVDWIYEDPVFYNNFRSWCLTLIEKGFSFVRIMKPMENKEHFLKNTLLWFPLYMTGRVHLYYYPHFRDDIFRQTIITVDHAASYFSSSIARTNTCYYSFFSADADLSDAYVKQIKDYIGFCKPSFYICQTEPAIASAFSELMALPGDRITKSYTLSPESFPYTEMVAYLQNAPEESYRLAALNIKRLYSAHENAQEGHVTIDMCTLSTPEDIKNGKVRMQLPGFVNRHPIYYNTELYAMHLRHILHMLETNMDYHFYPIQAADFGEYSSDYAPISAVDHQAVLLAAQNLVLHFTQPDIIHTLYEHLYNEAKIRAKDSDGRHHIMSQIRSLLEQLS